MPILTSASTLAEVQAAYDDNASYAEQANVAMARSFVTAIRILLRRVAAEAGTRDGNYRFDLGLLHKELQAAEEWIAANDVSTTALGGPSVTRCDFRNFRD